MRIPKILGISASLRNGRYGTGSEALVAELKDVHSAEDLKRYLAAQAKIRVQEFVEAGRKDGLAFDMVYRNLMERRGERGLSNSEVALAAGLWGALKKGAEIEHLGLASYFPAFGRSRNLEELRARVRAADGILLSGPVYFGDRGSLAQALIDLLREDVAASPERAQIYAGISVGAKRNGGQETTLIYQMLDMTHLGFLAVGNDAETTAQYGGTGHAGDVGTMPQDSYGIETSMGAGRRIGHVARLLTCAEGYRLSGPLKVQIWVLQDRDGTARGLVEHLVADVDPREAEIQIVELTETEITRCIACDICPTYFDDDRIYRCVIGNSSDGVKQLHEVLIRPDVVLVCMFSPKIRQGLRSVYQTFLERTRYIRRGDYILSDTLVAPLVLEELGAHENLHVRALTSMIRHHTIMHAPIILYLQDGLALNREAATEGIRRFIRLGRRVTVGRLRKYLVDAIRTSYHPVGYVLSAARDREEKAMNERERAVEERFARLRAEAKVRVHPEDLPLDVAQIGSPT